MDKERIRQRFERFNIPDVNFGLIGRHLGCTPTQLRVFLLGNLDSLTEEQLVKLNDLMDEALGMKSVGNRNPFYTDEEGNLNFTTGIRD